MRYFTAFALLLGSHLGAQTVLQSGTPTPAKDSVYTAEATASTASEATAAATRQAYDQAFHAINKTILRCAGNLPDWELPNFGSVALIEKKIKNGFSAQAKLLVTERSIKMLIDEALEAQSMLKQDAVRSCLSKS